MFGIELLFKQKSKISIIQNIPAVFAEGGSYGGGRQKDKRINKFKIPLTWRDASVQCVEEQRVNGPASRNSVDQLIQKLRICSKS